VKVLTDYFDAGECLHPQVDRDVDALLKEAVMAICRPLAGAPKKMSGKEAGRAGIEGVSRPCIHGRAFTRGGRSPALRSRTARVSQGTTGRLASPA
jgi:hypothetical protein